MLPDPNFSPEELAAFNVIQDLIAQVDQAFGVTGEAAFLGIAPVEISDSDFSLLELSAMEQINAVLFHADDIDAYRPSEIYEPLTFDTEVIPLPDSFLF